MCVKEFKGEAIKNQQQEPQLNGGQINKLNDGDEERQNPHKIRFDAHLDIVNKADKKKFSGKTLRLSIYELVPALNFQNPAQKPNAKNKITNVTTYHSIQECPDRS
jgi:hypothetical protein